MGQVKRSAYGDESMRGASYLLAIVLVEPSAQPVLDRLTRSLCLPTQRRLHLKAESDSRARQIIDVFVRSESFRALVYKAPRPAVTARHACLREAVGDLAALGVPNLILDRVDERQASRDRVTIAEVLRKCGVELAYRHAESREHAGLQVADAVAWAFGAGGVWRKRIMPVVQKSTTVLP